MRIEIIKAVSPVERVLIFAPETPGLADLEVTGADSDALLAVDPSILHIVTHGNEQGIMAGKRFLEGAYLGRLLTQHHVKVVLAMSCKSAGFSAPLLAAGISYVISVADAAGRDIENDSARRFAREFYRALLAGRSVVQAFEYGRSRLRADDAGLLQIRPDSSCQGPDDPALRELAALRKELEEFKAVVVGNQARIIAALVRVESTSKRYLKDVIRSFAQLVEAVTQGQEDTSGATKETGAGRGR
jgi:hypothetical protein